MADGFETVDTVLIAEQDAEVRAALRDLALRAQNFRVIEAQDGPSALSVFLRTQPDLVMLALELPGLSGRDLLVALKSQGFSGPVIMLADKDSPHTPIEALRLGAKDFIIKPFREAEVLAAVESCMDGIQVRRQRDALVKNLEATNQELEARMQQLTALYEVGEGVAALNGIENVSQRVLENVVTLTQADYALLLLCDDALGKLVLHAGKNLPISITDRQSEPAADELADLVMTTREMLVADVDTLRGFNTDKGVFAAMYAPLVVQNTALGVLVVANHQRRVNFTDSDERLVRGLANHLAMAVVSQRLTKLLEKRSNAVKTAYRELRERDARRTRQLRSILASLQRPLVAIDAELIRLSRAMAGGQNTPETSQELITLSKQVRQMITHVTSLAQHSDHALTVSTTAQPKPTPPQKAIATEE